MRMKNLLAFVLFLTFGLVLCTAAGCKKKDAASEAPTEVAAEEPTQQVTQRKENVRAAVEIEPAPDENTIAEGHAFPPLEFTNLSGEQINLANLRGKVVLIDFWATWCGPCRAVMPDLVETYEQYHDKGFEIIGISLDKDKSQLEKYMQDIGITWPQYYDGLVWNNKIAKRFGVRGIPHIVLVDKNGAVHFNTDYIELRDVVAELCKTVAN